MPNLPIGTSPLPTHIVAVVVDQELAVANLVVSGIAVRGVAALIVDSEFGAGDSPSVPLKSAPGEIRELVVSAIAAIEVDNGPSMTRHIGPQE